MAYTIERIATLVRNCAKEGRKESEEGSRGHPPTRSADDLKRCSQFKCKRHTFEINEKYGKSEFHSKIGITD